MSQWIRAAMPLFLVIVATPALTASAEPVAAPPSATLTVLAPPVHRLATGQPSMVAAPATMDLRDGDRVITGQGGLALITFLDGSTVTVESNSDVTVRQTDRGRSPIRLFLNVGKVWARVARLVGRESSVSLESNEYAAAAHDGLIGAEEVGDGTFVCWTRAGRVTLTDARGRRLASLMPGQKATAAGLGRPLIEPFSVNASVLEVVASGAALPLVQMPDGQRAAGFVAPDREVNLVFGSLTSARAGAEGLAAARLVEVPAGRAGRYRLVLTGLADGPFRVTIVGRHRGAPVWHHVEAGTIGAGEHAVFSIEQRVDIGDPRTARAREGSVVRLTPRSAPPRR